METNYPELCQFPSSTSKMWEREDNRRNFDNWWFKFNVASLDGREYIIFAGAKDYINREFKIFRVPAEYILANLGNLDVTHGGRADGWVNIYVHLTDYVDVRNEANLHFGQFALN